MVIAVASVFGTPRLAMAQTTTAAPAHVPLQKTIGQPDSAIVPSLIVFNSRGATLQDGKLSLLGVAPNSIVFADRPVRAAGHVLTADILEEWENASGTFAQDPPNATVSVFGKDGSVHDAVVVMKTPKLEGDRLTFDVDLLEGDLSGSDGPASVFIDRFGHSFGGGGRVGGFGGAGGFDRGGAVGVGGGNRFGAVSIGGGNRVGVVGVNHGAWYRGAAVGAAVGLGLGLISFIFPLTI
jgi:hypothetical protein